jgi:hypothetical protein
VVIPHVAGLAAKAGRRHRRCACERKRQQHRWVSLPQRRADRRAKFSLPRAGSANPAEPQWTIRGKGKGVKFTNAARIQSNHLGGGERFSLRGWRNAGGRHHRKTISFRTATASGSNSVRLKECGRDRDASAHRRDSAHRDDCGRTPDQTNAFRRRGVRQQRRLFARWNQPLRRSPNSKRLC